MATNILPLAMTKTVKLYNIYIFGNPTKIDIFFCNFVVHNWI